METILQLWLSVWLYLMAAIGLVLSILVFRKRKAWDAVNLLCTLAIIVLVLHVLEEWVFPGGLHYSYNLSHSSSVLSRYPMNRLTDMITNLGGVLLGCIVLRLWGFGRPAGLAIMMFSAFEVVIHIIIGISSLRIFSPYGMNTLYSPGLVTSLFGFLPVSVGLGAVLFGAKPYPTIRQWAMAVLSMLALCFLLINLPEMLLSDENSPYAFTNRGYYERFAPAFEAEHPLEYR